MDLYQNRLLTEGIRIIEKTSPSASFNADYSALNFEDALSKRTQLAELRYQTRPVFMHFQHLVKLFFGLMCLFFLVLGASSVSQFLVNESDSQINFFWAVVLFIAPNILSLIIWFFLYFKKNVFSISWLTNLSLSLITLLDKLHHKVTTKHPHYIALFQYYFEHRFGSYMGRAQLSFISHIWWASYLLGATLSLLIVLATHQVDFIWQTTILSEDTFLWLTQLLGYIPNILAINVPSASDVSHASIGLVNSLQVAQESRISWSNLLIFSLVIYALVPRVLLAVVFNRAMKNKKSKFKVNYSLPYYVQLKSLLHPIVNAHFIVDADEHKNAAVSKGISENKQYNHALVIPEQAYPVAIELNNDFFQQASKHVLEYYSGELINVVDSQSQQVSLFALQLSQSEHVILYADFTRLPDRGWLSLVKKYFYKNNVQVYLILLGNEAVDPNSQLLKRLQDWIEIVAEVNILAPKITYLINEKKTQSTSDEVKNG